MIAAAGTYLEVSPAVSFIKNLFTLWALDDDVIGNNDLRLLCLYDGCFYFFSYDSWDHASLLGFFSCKVNSDRAGLCIEFRDASFRREKEVAQGGMNESPYAPHSPGAPSEQICQLHRAE